MISALRHHKRVRIVVLSDGQSCGRVAARLPHPNILCIMAAACPLGCGQLLPQAESSTMIATCLLSLAPSHGWQATRARGILKAGALNRPISCWLGPSRRSLQTFRNAHEPRHARGTTYAAWPKIWDKRPAKIFAAQRRATEERYGRWRGWW